MSRDMTIVATQSKLCTRCGEEKSLSESCNSGKKNRRPSDIYSAGVVVKIERLLEKQSADWDAVQTIPQCGSLCAVNVKELHDA